MLSRRRASVVRGAGTPAWRKNSYARVSLRHEGSAVRLWKLKVLRPANVCDLIRLESSILNGRLYVLCESTKVPLPLNLAATLSKLLFPNSIAASDHGKSRPKTPANPLREACGLRRITLPSG